MIPNISFYEQLMFERVQEWQREAERQRLVHSIYENREREKQFARTAWPPQATSHALVREKRSPAPLLDE